MNARRVAFLLALLPLLAGSAGCLGYHLAGHATTASFIPPEVHRIGIPPFGNQTDKPRLDQRISEALINEFVQRGRYEALPDTAGADAILEGTVENFRTEPVTFSTTGRYDRVEVTVTARIRLVQTSPEKVLWAQNHFVFRQQYDLPQSAAQQTDLEIGALEEIARDFARSTVTSILEGF